MKAPTLILRLPVPARRLAYRLGYEALQAVWLITRPRLEGVKCVIADADRILLVRHSYGRRWWDLPGGTLDRGEPPHRAARREMHEELGLDGVEWEPLGQVVITGRRHTDLLSCFGAELHDPVLELDHGELLEARWFGKGQLPSDRAPQVTAILGHVAALLAQVPPPGSD